jgi:hypothetical protein
MFAGLAALVGRGAFIGLAALLAIVVAPQARAADTDQVEGDLAVITSSVRQFAGQPVEGPFVSLLIEVDGRFYSIDLTPAVVVLDADGRQISLNDLRPGERLRASGVWESPTRLVAEQVERTSS